MARSCRLQPKQKKKTAKYCRKLEDAEPIRDDAEISKSKQSTLNIPLPFPNRVTQNKKIVEPELDKKIMETFRKV